MAKGDVTYKVTDFTVNRTGAQATVRANATKFVEDEDGALQSIGSWTGTLSYVPATLAAKTISTVLTELTAEIKARNAAISGKTIA